MTIADRAIRASWAIVCTLAVAGFTMAGDFGSARAEPSGTSPKANPVLFTFEPDPRLRRILKKPLDTEVSSGQAANILLPLLHRLPGPTIALDKDLLGEINVTTGRADTSLGALLRIKPSSWPGSLRGLRQRKLTQLLPQAVDQTLLGTRDSDLFRQVKKELGNLQEENRRKFHREEIDGGTYLEGKRFLDSLDGAVGLLSGPEADRFLNGTLAPRGNNVRELVEHMTRNSLRFAPASPGHERAYLVLHQAMIEYINGTQTDLTPFLPKKIKPVKVRTSPGSPGITTWLGNEDRPGYGSLEFRFLTGGQAIMIDAKGTFRGSFVQAGRAITITFPGIAIYTGVIQGQVMSGTARDSFRVWQWSVRYHGDGTNSCRPPP